MSDDPQYCYLNTSVLRNKLGLTDPERLEEAERLLSRRRLLEDVPTGNFDLDHLRAIHGHVFQDVYEWAGQVREVEINKGGSQFQFRQYIDTGMADVHRRLTQADFLRGLDANAFAAKAGEIIGDVNYVHPFREGNGRTQREYLVQLAAQAGHTFRVDRLDREQWTEASIAAHQGNYRPMAEAIRSAIAPDKEIEKQADTEEPEWLNALEKRQADETRDMERRHRAELKAATGSDARSAAADRHEAEAAALKSSHAADKARRIEDERRAQELLARRDEERTDALEKQRSR